MKVAEKFVSINGEGQKAGELAVFVRFTGCNLNCSYCDTKWANEPHCNYEELSVDEIYDYILSTKVKNVTLTGGEPLLHSGIYNLCAKLSEDNNLKVEIETNGSVSIEKYKLLKNPPSI
ncbi:MAG: radical SAM protein, partial [Lachnospirales bacterium]